jgi:hypothetical protein
MSNYNYDKYDIPNKWIEADFEKLADICEECKKARREKAAEACLQCESTKGN